MQPPKWADRFLSFYCNPDLLEEIQGDCYELFDRAVQNGKPTAAKWIFIWNVLRFFRWSNIKRSKTQNRMNQLGMFSNYFRVGLRNMTKHWSVAFINIFGLAIAISLAITTFLFIDFQLNMDQFHSKKDQIYQIVNRVNDGEGTALWGDSPLLLGPQLQAEHPAVENVVRFEFQYGNMRHDKKVFSEFVTFVDQGYFDMFDFDIKYGNRNALKDKRNIVLSEALSIKYFGEENPVGEQVSIKYANGTIQQYVIGAVMTKFPATAAVSSSLLVPIDNFYDLELEQNYDWSYFTDATFVELKKGTDPNALQPVLAGYKSLQNNSKSKWAIQDFELISLNGLALRGFDIDGSIAEASHPAGRVALSVLAGILLILACFNYMNIAVASATKRLKEIAMRKVMGGARGQIIVQFLFENLIQVAIALLGGLALSYFVMLPGFNKMIPITIPFEFSSLPVLVLFFLGMLIIIGLLSGAYPALYISKFQPTSIFKGKAKFGGKNLFSRILLGFQFFFSFSTIVGSLIFVDNARYLAQKDWGYDPSGVLSIAINNETEFQALRDAAASMPEVKQIAGSKGHIGRSNTYTNVDQLESKMGTFVYKISPDYFDAMRIRLKEGRFFNRNSTTDQENAIVINEKFAAKMGWEDPLSEWVTYDSTRREVIGVVEDFHYNMFYDDIDPVMFTLEDQKAYDYFIVQADHQSLQQLQSHLEEAWLLVAPNDPYLPKFQSDVFDSFFLENRANVIIISVIAGIAIILTALGLFGLFAFNIRKKLKEFSVRKVLGARPLDIIRIASKEYFWVIIISMVLGMPAGYLLINQLIQSIYPSPSEAGPLPFVVSLLIVMVTVALTIAGQVLRATRVNPAETLRSE